MNRQYRQAGFTAIELLITMFVGAAFILTGYQLYAVIIRGGNVQQTKAVASNAAYYYLREYSSVANNTTDCTAAQPVNNTSIGVYIDGSYNPLPQATVSVVISCPYGTSSPVSRVTSTVYDSLLPSTGVSHAIYVTH